MTADAMARLTVLVEGQVQGVFFRASTLEQAQSLSLAGWVQNQPDGGVEIVAEGPRYALESLLEWARRGPPAAHVTEVWARWTTPLGEFKTFTVRR